MSTLGKQDKTQTGILPQSVCSFVPIKQRDMQKAVAGAKLKTSCLEFQFNLIKMLIGSKLFLLVLVFKIYLEL